MPPMPAARQEVGVAAVEGRIYVIGGLDANLSGQRAVDIFNTRSGEWEPGPPLPFSLHHPNVAAVGHKVYVAGGYAEIGVSAATFELDTDRMTWARKAGFARRARLIPAKPLHHAHALFSDLGSRASRRPSPKRLKPRTANEMAKPDQIARPAD